MPIMAGNGGLPVDGYETVAVNDVDLPPSDTFTVIAPFENDPLTVDGRGGLTPSS